MLWFYSFILQMEQKKMIPFWVKTPKEKRDIYRWEKDSFFSKVEITREIVWIKIFKKDNFKKI